MAGVLIDASRWSNEKRGYPTADNPFCALLGESVAAFDKGGNVFGLEGDVLRQPDLEWITMRLHSKVRKSSWFGRNTVAGACLCA
jgi:hypothetical protein